MIEISILTKLNMADFQNATPLIYDLKIVNTTSEVYRNIELILDSSPKFVKTRHWRIDTLAADSHYSISDLSVHLDSGLLGKLTESELATVSLTLRSMGDATTSALACCNHYRTYAN